MKIRLYLAAFLVFGFIPCAVYAQDDYLTIDLAQNHVDITTGFHGTYLQIFGVRQAAGDIAIVIQGPKRPMSVRRKEKIFGAWINKEFQDFEKIPSFYAYALSVPLADLAAPAVLDEQQIGPSHINFTVKDGKQDPDKIAIFKKALIRNKQARGLFAIQAEDILFLNPGFFRTQIYMPANVPVGDYVVTSYYFQDGQPVDIKTNIVKVAQIGLSAEVFEFAHRKRFLYALMCIGLALAAGWFSNRIRLKN